VSCTQGPAGGATTVVARAIYNLTTVTTATPFVLADHIDVSMYTEVTLLVRAHAAAARTIRSFSDAEKTRLLPGFGTVSAAAPLAPAGSPRAARAGSGLTDRRWEGLGTRRSILRPWDTDIEEMLSHATLAQGEGGIGSLTGDGYATMEGYRSFG
jgi:hypothetical protein